jgi:hypothetical protein
MSPCAQEVKRTLLQLGEYVNGTHHRGEGLGATPGLREGRFSLKARVVVPHLGLLPELLTVNPFHFHGCVSLLVGGALQSQTP